MSKRLEDFIRNNKEDFDELEPRMELWGNIVAKLQEQEKAVVLTPVKREAKTFSLGFVLKVAAAVILVMGVSFVFYIRSQKPDIYTAINPEYAKQRVQYASLVDSKRTELKTLTKTNPELYQEFSTEIAKMDSTYKKLNHDLATSPNQERVLRAMIRNLQLQTEVLNQQLNVIEQFNELNKPKNETKSI
jgi:hypothetical protein